MTMPNTIRTIPQPITLSVDLTACLLSQFLSTKTATTPPTAKTNPFLLPETASIKKAGIMKKR